MKIIIRLFLLVIFGLTSCQKKETPMEHKYLENKLQTNVKTELSTLNTILNQYEIPSQLFTIMSDKSTKIVGKNGTSIFVNPSNLVMENGETIGENIEIELKELTNQEQLFRGNAQTTSNGQLLVSGGAYYINLTSDGKQLRLKEGKSLTVMFPKFTSNEMQLFYGERDTLGQMNWEKTDQTFENITNQKVAFIEQAIQVSPSSSTNEIDSLIAYIELDSTKPLTKEEKKMIEVQKKNFDLADKFYKAVELKKFGWINCDRFYDIANKTNLHYVFNKKDSIVSANVYLLFSDINSMMTDYYYEFQNKRFYSGFQNIPYGAKTKLIAFSVKNGKTQTYQSELIIKTNETIELTLQETNQDDIEKLFQLN